MSSIFQYRKSLDEARYKQLAQKLDHLLSNLHQDINTEVRWIWQLIQNAKDVPNQFGKAKIRVIINENSMTFSHNGDPFRPSDLESVVGQYSKKVEENSAETQTTGKYGTGFVTTYILSKRIKINGILVVEDMQEDLDELDFDSDGELEKLNSCRSMTSLGSNMNEPLGKLQHSASISNFEEIKQTQIKQKNGDSQQSVSNFIKLKKIKQKKNPENQSQGQKQQDLSSQKSQKPKLVFQKFSIPLNRQYKNRQKDFPQTLRKNQFKIMKILYGLQNQEPWQRKIDDFDTSFTYQKLDSTSFKMIITGINSLKQLFPYALCFNTKLHEIQVQDKRKIRQIEDFTITKQNSQKIGNIEVSVCSITEKQITSKKFLAFKTDPKTRCTVAIPIDIGDKKIRLLKINNKMPKAFKQFPLIGVKDTGYNFAFTCQNFYPNQTRSNLLLNKIQGRENKKATQNWQGLQSILNLNLQLTKSLSKVVNRGQQNFIQVNQIPFMGNQHEIFKKYFDSYMNELIPKLKIVQYKNGQLRTLDNLIFIHDFSGSKEVTDQIASTQINQVFSFLFKNSEILSAQLHQGWYENINRNRKYFQQKIYFRNLEFCLSKISQLSFQKLKLIFGHQNAAVEKLRQIYATLSKYRPSILNFNAPKSNFKIVLTKSYQLKYLNQDNISFVQTLKKKTNLPKIYEDLCKIFRINIKSYLIHEDLADYFTNTYSFRVQQANQRISNYFCINELFKDTITDYNQPSRFTDLLRYLKSMKIGEKLLSTMEEMNIYDGIKELEVDMKEFQQLHIKEQDLYQVCAQKIFLKRLDQSIIENSTVNFLSTKLKNYKGNIKSTIQWYDKILKMDHSQGRIKKNITWSQIFRKNQSIKHMDPYPNQQDIQFYNKLIQIRNSRKKQEFWKEQNRRKQQQRKFKGYFNFVPGEFNQSLFLKAQLVHPEISPKYNQKVNYKHFFDCLKIQFNQLNAAEKIEFLDYVHKIHEAGDQSKMIYDDLAATRHVELIKLTNLTKTEIGAIYDFTKQKGILPRLRELITEFGMDKLMQIMNDHGKIAQGQYAK